MSRFNFTSQDYLRDPAAALAKLRAAGSVVEVHFPIIGRTWITTTGDLAARVLKGQRDVYDAQQRHRGWLALVDARMGPHARDEHADDG